MDITRESIARAIEPYLRIYAWTCEPGKCCQGETGPLVDYIEQLVAAREEAAGKDADARLERVESLYAASMRDCDRHLAEREQREQRAREEGERNILRYVDVAAQQIELLAKEAERYGNNGMPSSAYRDASNIMRSCFPRAATGKGDAK